MSTWQIDSAHTVAGFVAKHMMVSKVRGMLTGATGSITFDEADPTRSSVEVTIPAASIDSGNEMRDRHLRSADFLDTDNFATIDFRSTSVARTGDRWAISGDLSIRGVTRTIVLDTEQLGIVIAKDGRRHAGFEASARLKRSDWGLTWNVGLETGGWLVSGRRDPRARGRRRRNRRRRDRDGPGRRRDRERSPGLIPPGRLRGRTSGTWAGPSAIEVGPGPPIPRGCRPSGSGSARGGRAAQVRRVRRSGAGPVRRAGDPPVRRPAGASGEAGRRGRPSGLRQEGRVDAVRRADRLGEQLVRQ